MLDPRSLREAGRTDRKCQCKSSLERSIATELFHLTDSVKECRTVRRRNFLLRERLVSHALVVLKVMIYCTSTCIFNVPFYLTHV